MIGVAVVAVIGAFAGIGVGVVNLRNSGSVLSIFDPEYWFEQSGSDDLVVESLTLDCDCCQTSFRRGTVKI